MNFAAYGLSQGMAGQNQGNQLINAMNTASLIQYRRDQQRLQNRYADIAQQNVDLAKRDSDLAWEKWGMESQQQELQLQSLQYQFDNLKKEQAGKDFGFDFFNAMTSGNWGVVNNKLSNNQYINPIARQQNVANISDPRDYTPEALRKYGVEVPEGMDLNNYILVKGFDNSYRLVDKNQSAALVGVGNVVDSYTLEQAQKRTQMAQTEFNRNTIDSLNSALTEVTNFFNKNKSTMNPTQVQDFSKIIDDIANLTSGTQLKESKPTNKELEIAGRNKVQHYIDNFDKYSSADFPDMIRALSEGDESQKVTLSEKILDSIIASNPKDSLDTLKQRSDFRQVYQYLEKSLTSSQSNALNQSRKEDVEDNTLIQKYQKLVAEEGLKLLANKTFWQQGSDWFRQLMTKFSADFVKVEDQKTRQTFQGLFNTLLKITSGGAVTLSESERKEFELGNLKNQNAVTALIGLQNLANEILTRKKTRANQSIISKYDNLDSIKNIEWYISEIDKQLGRNKPNATNVTSKSSNQTPTQQIDNEKWLRGELKGAKQ